jgi:adenine-specific DNA-methyltransferase
MNAKANMRQQVMFESNAPISSIKRTDFGSEVDLVAVAMALGARGVAGWSQAEEQLASKAGRAPNAAVVDIRDRIEAGEDPLGDAFCSLRPPAQRRNNGATFTPRTIIDAMVDWAAESVAPVRVVDPGAGSGRYLVAAGRRNPKASLVGIEIDPLPAILARANLAVLGLAKRSAVVVDDYRAVSLPPVNGQTLFIGNPPYVRHHLIDPHWKTWMVDQARKRGRTASQLAGLHVHFFLATMEKAVHGDFGVFITAAEWLDVNYGSLVRELFLGELGGKRLVVIEPTAVAFPDAASTAAIAYFQIGAKPKRIKLKRVERLEDLGDSNGNREVRRERLEAEKRWSHLTRAVNDAPQGYIELGELCRVHRGQVTGLNKVWIAGSHSQGLPDSVLFPSVTKARELFRAGNALEDASMLRNVIDIPVDLDILQPQDRKAVQRFLTKAKSFHADIGYVATNRKAWWSVGLRAAAPILTTYMARRPPAFVHNRIQARHLNIAHGIYPREPFSQAILDNLTAFLRKNVQLSQGRTYAGGLTKFEPREVERLLVPGPDLLAQSCKAQGLDDDRRAGTGAILRRNLSGSAQSRFSCSPLGLSHHGDRVQGFQFRHQLGETPQQRHRREGHGLV